MSLATLADVLRPALAGGYAVAGLVTLGWEDMCAFVAAAEAEEVPVAYERLIMDVIRGNQTLFMRGDEVEAAWQWTDPILKIGKSAMMCPNLMKVAVLAPRMR